MAHMATHDRLHSSSGRQHDSIDTRNGWYDLIVVLQFGIIQLLNSDVCCYFFRAFLCSLDAALAMTLISKKYQYSNCYVKLDKLFECLRIESIIMAMTWREHHDVSNHRELECLFHSFFMLTKVLLLRIIASLWGESGGDWWIPITNGQQCRKCYDIIMIFSRYYQYSLYEWPTG